MSHAAKAVLIGVRPVDVGSVTSTYRPSAAPDAVRALPSVADSSAVDLAPTAIVPHAEAALGAGHDNRGGERPAATSGDGTSDLAHRVIIDPDTQEIIFQSVNDQTQDVVRQYPDQAILRRRAYVQQSEERTVGLDPATQIERVV